MVFPEFIESPWLKMPPKKKVGKQCLHCACRLPLESFEEGRSVCRECRTRQKVEANRLRNKKHADLIVKPIPPPKAKAKPKKAKKKASSPAKKSSPPSFANRNAAESYIAQQIHSDIDALDALVERYEAMLDETMVVKEQKDITARIEACIQKRVELSMKLVKSFDLFSDLGKPVDDNPLYTPVTVVINSKMPSSCIVEPKFERDPEFIQPEVADGDDDSTAADEDTE